MKRSAVMGGGYRRKWLILTLCASMFICSMFFRVSNAIIAPLIQSDLDISSEALGILGAAFFYAFAMAQIPIGISLDWIGSRLTMTVLTLTGAIGAMIFSFSQGMSGAVLGRALLGLGMSANLMGSMKLFTRWFSPREFATLSGFMMALGTLGTMLAATPLALLVNTVGWRYAFIILSLITSFLAVIFFLLVRDFPKDAIPSAAEDRQAVSILRYAALSFFPRFLDHQLRVLCTVRRFRRHPGTVGRPLPDQRAWVFSGKSREYSYPVKRGIHYRVLVGRMDCRPRCRTAETRRTLRTGSHCLHPLRPFNGLGHGSTLYSWGNLLYPRDLQLLLFRNVLSYKGTDALGHDGDGAHGH